MEPAELDIMLEELENRVERLRSLYEQYFLGIEKIPPFVAQKDVDRRLYTLRREQIRNTARRFKLQTIVQRYNTFQQYWMRIMREIENGTYRRHVLRAERTVGITDLLTANERKRLGLPERPSPSSPPMEGEGAAARAASPSELPAANQSLSAAPAEAEALAQSPAKTSADMRAALERDLARLLDSPEGDDLDALDTNSMKELGKELDDPLLSSMPPPARGRRPSAKPLPRPSTRPSAPTMGRASSPRSGIVHPETPQPPAAANAAAPRGLRLPASSAVAGRGLPPKPVPRGAPAKIPSRPIISVGGEPESGASHQPVAPIPPRVPQIAPTGPSPAPKLSSPDQPSPPVSPAVASRPAIPPRPPRNSAPIASPPQVPRPTRPDSALVSETAAESSGPRSSQPNRESVPRGLPDPRESVIPRASRPPGPPSVTPKVQPLVTAKGPATATSKPKTSESTQPGRTGAAAGSTATASTPLDRARIEQLAEKLRDARKQTHESAAVSVDALARKLQTTADELRKKHSGKRVDFDVVIKDGKAILKPIVR